MFITMKYATTKNTTEISCGGYLTQKSTDNSLVIRLNVNVV